MSKERNEHNGDMCVNGWGMLKMQMQVGSECEWELQLELGRRATLGRPAMMKEPRLRPAAPTMAAKRIWERLLIDKLPH